MLHTVIAKRTDSVNISYTNNIFSEVATVIIQVTVNYNHAFYYGVSQGTMLGPQLFSPR